MELHHGAGGGTPPRGGPEISSSRERKENESEKEGGERGLKPSARSEPSRGSWRKGEGGEEGGKIALGVVRAKSKVVSRVKEESHRSVIEGERLRFL